MTPATRNVVLLAGGGGYVEAPYTLSTPALLEAFDADNFTTSGLLVSKTVNTTNRIQGAGCMELLTDGASVGSQGIVRANIGNYDVATLGTIAVYWDRTSAGTIYNLDGSTTQGTITNLFLSLNRGVANDDMSLAHESNLGKGGRWFSFHASELTNSYAAGLGQLGMKFLIKPQSPFNASGRVDALYANAGGRATLVMTFDDMWVTTLTTVAPMMAAYGFKGTAYVVQQLFGSGGVKMTLAQLQQLYNTYNFDIGTDSHDDSDLTTVDVATATADVVAQKDLLIANGMPRGAYHGSYPFGRYTEELADSLTAAGMITMRGVEATSFYTRFGIPRGHRIAMPAVSMNSTSGTLAALKTALDLAVLRGETLITFLHDCQAVPSANGWTPADFQDWINYVHAYVAAGVLSIKTQRELWERDGLPLTNTVPSAFGSADWTIVDNTTAGDALLTLVALPADGMIQAIPDIRQDITDVEYDLNGSGTGVSLASIALGEHFLSGFTDGVPTSMRVRAISAQGNGTWSAAKVFTTTDTATVPAQPSAGSWSLTDLVTGGSATLTITSLPANGGVPITGLSYQVNGGSWISLGAITTGSYTVPGLTYNVSNTVSWRASNFVGDGTGAATKSVTPTIIAASAAHLARFTTPPDQAHVVAVNTLLTAMIANGSLNSNGTSTYYDALYLYAAADSQAGLLNVVDTTLYGGAVVSAPTFTADRGYTPDGAAKYVTTSFNPATASSPKFVRDSAMMVAAHLTDLAGAGATTSGDNGGNTAKIQNTSAAQTGIAANGTNLTIGAEDYIAVKTWTRENATDVRYFRNGVINGADPRNNASAAPFSFAFCTGRTATSAAFGLNQCALFGFGKFMPAAMVAADAAAFLVYLRALGCTI